MYLYMGIEVRFSVESVFIVVIYKFFFWFVVGDMKDEIIYSVVNFVIFCICKFFRVVCCFTVSVDDMFMIFFYVF